MGWRRRLLLLAPVGIAAVAAAALVVVSQRSAEAPPSTDTVAGIGAARDMLAGVPASGDTIGDPAATVTITEYGDLRCPVCRDYAEQVVPTLVADLVRTGRAKLRLRVWPILGPDSIAAAHAAHAAAQQDALWMYSHIWYANQGPESEEYATAEYVRRIAVAAGLDLERFDADRAGAAADAAWQAVDEAAQDLGLQGTPGLVIDGPGGTRTFDTVPEAAEIAAAVADLAA
jgi:protein-disulfide isomerase